MKQTKIKVALILVAVFVLLVGCGGENVSEQAVPTYTPYQTKDSGTPNWKKYSNSDAKKEEEPQATEAPMDIVDGDLEKNFDEAMKHVTICGKKVSFPTTLNELGEDFEFQESRVQSELKNYTYGTLIYKNKEVLDIAIKTKSKKQDIRIGSICFLVLEREEYPDTEFDVCGISLNSTEGEIVETFGNYTEKNAFGSIIYYRNENKKNKHYIKFSDFDNAGCPKSIWINI